MKTLIRCAVLLLCVAAAATASPSASPYRIRFGLFQKDGHFKISNRLPLHINQGYGWIADIPALPHPNMDNPLVGRIVHWREILTVPKPPRSWGGLPSFDSPMEYGSISRDRRTGVIEGDLPALNGHILHAWEVAAGDPSGAYHMSVVLDGYRVGSVVFDAR